MKDNGFFKVLKCKRCGSVLVPQDIAQANCRRCGHIHRVVKEKVSEEE